MKAKVTIFFTAVFISLSACCQIDDTMQIYKYLTLDSVIISDVRGGFDVNAFIRLVEDDTTFYQAFRNLRKVEYTSASNILIYDKKGKQEASYAGIATQLLKNNCRWMQFSNENIMGDFYDDGDMNYYTAKMFAYIFLYRDTICNNNKTTTASYDKKIESRKDQLKIIMFDPGKKVDGIPFIKNKTAVFDFDIMKHYDFFISSENYLNVDCYVFSFQLNEDSKQKDVVVQQMKTWFDKKTFQIVARTYDLRYDAGVYDFDVQMDVQLGMKNNIYIPTQIKYTGNWDVPGKSRERGRVEVYID
ncbi:MAG: hypothetical protein H7Y00_00590 [Fimbriimonadaceae bacterium]|nr:hypothetical protein [Chitinophagales bacterium]